MCGGSTPDDVAFTGLFRFRYLFATMQEHHQARGKLATRAIELEWQSPSRTKEGKDVAGNDMTNWNLERLAGAVSELTLAALTREDYRTRVLDLLDQAVGTDVSCFQSTCNRGRSYEVAGRGFQPELLTLHGSSWMSEFTPEEIKLVSSGRLRLMHELLPLARREQLALVREFVVPNGLTSLASVIWRNQHGICAVGFGRSGITAFRSAELAKLDQLLPTLKLAEAYWCSIETAESRSLSPRFEAWADGVSLTQRERAVADLAARGFQNKEIAGLLRVSVYTVRNQLAAVFRKAEVTTRAELAHVSTAPADDRSKDVCPSRAWTSWVAD